MRQTPTLTDRIAARAVPLLALAHVALFVAFLASLLLVSGKVRAQEMPVCTGTDLMAGIVADDPAAYARIEAEAAKTVNGRALLWKLEKAGTEPSWLFGTMHMTDPRVTTLTPAAEIAFASARTVVIETTEILDQAKMMEALFRQPELMMFTDGTTLASLVSPEDAATLNTALEARGIPPASVAAMKPWMLSTMVALPACELSRKAGGLPILDQKLAEDAAAAGKSVEGLETVADQLGAMASLPMDFHMQGLVETLKLGDRMDDIVETMIVLYKQERTDLFWPLFRETMPQQAANDGYAAFETAMITSRNHTMAVNAGPILARGSAFVAVGALHLPGEEGLVELFREAGYAVTAVE